jgi:peptide deformylase
MLATMYQAPGIGLAAPQVGVLSRLFVMDCVKEEGETPRPMVLVNPEITWTSDERATYEEGCLSIPEHYAEVTRPAPRPDALDRPLGQARARRSSRGSGRPARSTSSTT